MDQLHSTLTPVPSQRKSAGSREARLHLAFQCDRPLLGSARWLLEPVETIQIGRATSSSPQPADPAARHLLLRLADRCMSQAHACLRRAGSHWLVEDARSKNGTRVNGAAVEQALLADGDVLELGQSFFVFRDAPGIEEGAPAVLEERDLRSFMPGLPTWLPGLARDLAGLESLTRSRAPVVIRGESGTGKEVVARAVHEVSGRSGALVAVNCGAIAENLVESELFGHRKGAFSGADEDRPGLVRSADQGTLFLDEVGDLPPRAQTALLRVLQEGEVLPVGATRSVKVDTRLVVATHRDLDAMVAEGRFRADLLARIGGFTVSLPPLRERREDLGLLIAALLRRLLRESAERVAFSRTAARGLFAYDWPLNVRELERALEVAVVLARAGPIELEHLPKALREAKRRALAVPAARPEQPAEKQARRRDELVTLLRNHLGNVSAVGRALGKTRAQIHRWIKRFQIDVKSFRP
jgi:sigma-54 dependent transcriptional regulator, acetoin dehydrogenase operon transcriptional activator AcoR